MTACIMWLTEEERNTRHEDGAAEPCPNEASYLMDGMPICFECAADIEAAILEGTVLIEGRPAERWEVVLSASRGTDAG